ncbi:hypothetical protein Tco_1084346 [Tanacetum coccineum]
MVWGCHRKISAPMTCRHGQEKEDRVNLLFGLITLRRNGDGGPLLLEALQRFLKYEVWDSLPDAHLKPRILDFGVDKCLHWSRIRACIGVEFEFGKKLSEKTRLGTWSAKTPQNLQLDYLDYFNISPMDSTHLALLESQLRLTSISERS